MNTKERILLQAIDLFNEYGTASVSTNHIADAISISPGNLYYHFANKEEIIRAILQKMYAEWGERWTKLATVSPHVELIEQVLYDTFQLQWKYRFFYRELVALSRHDSQLADMHQRMQEKRMQEQQALVEWFIKHGVLRQPENVDDLQQTITICWIINNYWISFLESNALEPTAERLKEGLQLMMSVLEPYLNESIMGDE